MGRKYSLTGQPFTLIKKKDNQGQVLYQLQHGDGSVFSTYKDIKSHFSHLCPHGGAILKGKGKDTVCIGVLNFTDEALISPVFFTKENLTAAVQFFNPSSDIKQQVSGKAIENPGGRTFTQVDASPTRTDSSVHTPLTSSMTATPGATRPLFEPYPLVTGHHKKSTFAQRQAIVPERNISFSNGNPTPNDDIISNGDDRQQLLPKDDLQNTRLTAKDMLNGTLNLLTKSSELDREFDCEEIRRLKEQVSQSAEAAVYELFCRTVLTCFHLCPAVVLSQAL
ncbi:hypothetical protein OS493_034190 [Desmophyllum pertusum]|uniref:Uncharacterized protein n=1 Tax=Desmophyllum pertusum TaxID=174260 RepID=A0A9W9ZM47_9CNID|nr:hypothetical protein OS493_034190 [Desmophyllum pertusum]